MHQPIAHPAKPLLKPHLAHLPRPSLFAALFAALTAAATPAIAMPVAFTESFMVMTDLSEDSQEASASYSFKRGLAVQVGALRWKKEHMGQHTQRREIADVHLNWRAYRRNTTNSQLNVYLQAGAGSGRTESSGNETVLQWGGQVDWETTRLYTTYKGHRYLADTFNHTSHAVLGGFSFYEVDYDQVQPWLVAEAKRITNWSEDTEYSLLARFIYRSAFVEVGANQDGEPRFTFMYIF
jgi:hypothetical protein